MPRVRPDLPDDPESQRPPFTRTHTTTLADQTSNALLHQRIPRQFRRGIVGRGRGRPMRSKICLPVVVTFEHVLYTSSLRCQAVVTAISCEAFLTAHAFGITPWGPRCLVVSVLCCLLSVVACPQDVTCLCDWGSSSNVLLHMLSLDSAHILAMRAVPVRLRHCCENELYLNP